MGKLVLRHHRLKALAIFKAKLFLEVLFFVILFKYYVPKVTIQVQTDLEYSDCKFYAFKTFGPAVKMMTKNFAS